MKDLFGILFIVWLIVNTAAAMWGAMDASCCNYEMVSKPNRLNTYVLPGYRLGSGTVPFVSPFFKSIKQWLSEPIQETR